MRLYDIGVVGSHEVVNAKGVKSWQTMSNTDKFGMSVTKETSVGVALTFRSREYFSLLL